MRRIFVRSVTGTVVALGLLSTAAAHGRDLGEARHLYMRALGIADPSAAAARRRVETDVAHVLPAPVSDHLLTRAWAAREGTGDGFASPGERLQAMVELARRLGHGVYVGMLQACFGTPGETGVSRSHAEVQQARRLLAADPSHPDLRAEVARLESGLAREITAVLPRGAPVEAWLHANLDVDGNGQVGPADLEALDGRASSTDRNQVQAPDGPHTAVRARSNRSRDQRALPANPGTEV